MNQPYWRKQTIEQPLFEVMLWSRPENRLLAGKLLIIGGNAQSFAVPAEAYALAIKAGVGSARVMLPDALQKSVSKLFPPAEYGPSTPSGSFAVNALGEWLPAAASVDAVLLAGDLGRNSETAILLEKFLANYDGPLIVTRDVVEYAITLPSLLRDRPKTMLVLSTVQLQKFMSAIGFPMAVTSNMDLLRYVDTLHSLTNQYPFTIVSKHLDTLFVATDGQVSSTPYEAAEKAWRLRIATSASVWWLQNPHKMFEAICTSLIA